MTFLVIGINHRTTSVGVRERFSFLGKHLRKSLIDFKNSGLVSGVVILSTCNRTEMYLHIENDNFGVEEAKTFAFKMFCVNEKDIDRYFYNFKDVLAIRHLFRVASGMDSQVLGDNQILAQVKSAWAISKEAQASSDALDCIFQKAHKVGRMVRSKTKISHGNISVVSVAIKMLNDKLGSLSGSSALIIGAGKMSALISKYLLRQDIKGIFIASRTYARALELATECGGRAARLDRLEEELRHVDIVISSTSSPHVILKKETLIKVMNSRKSPLFIMDLALPRDVDPAARDIGGVSLYDLDDLKYVVEENYKNRQKEAVLAQAIVEKEISKFEGNEDLLWKQVQCGNCAYD